MAYLTPDELKAAIDEQYVSMLVDDASGTDQAAVKGDVIVLTEIITDASSVCDLYLAKQYAVPLVTVPASIKRIATQVAVYLLHERRHWTISDEIKSSYDSAVKMLEMIAKNELVVPGVNYISAGVFGADDREYTRSTMEAYG